MNAQEIIRFIAEAEKKTPVKLYVKEKAPIDYKDSKVFGEKDKIVFHEVGIWGCYSCFSSMYQLAYIA